MITETMGKSAFSKTVLKNLGQSLEVLYGSEKAILSHFILPGFACYKALKESGINSEESFDFVSKEIHKTSLCLWKTETICQAHNVYCLYTIGNK